MKVLAIVKDKSAPGAVEIYRITSPFMSVDLKTDHQFGWIPKNAFYDALEQRHYELADVDIFVFQRMLTIEDEKIRRMLKGLRDAGKLTVYECDDDYSGEYKVVGKHPDASWQPFIRNVDMVTVSTEGLANRVLECAPDASVQVLPNSIEREFWDEMCDRTEREPGPVRIMLAGSETHYADWVPFHQVIPAIDAKYDVQWVVAGFTPSYLEDLDLRRAIEFLDPVPYPKYPSLLVGADIGICALSLNDRFNESKSPIKAIEYWSAKRQLIHRKGRRMVKAGDGGAAVVATDHPVYEDVIDDGNNGLLAKHTAASYIDNISLLLDDPLLHRKLQIAGYREAKKYSIKKHWYQWKNVYEMLMERRVRLLS